MNARNSETCPACGRFTERGRQQEAMWHRDHPISKIDLSQPLSQVVAEVRSEIAVARGKLEDIGFGFTGWKHDLESPIGALTCTLIALHGTMERMREHELRYQRQPAPMRVDRTDPEGGIPGRTERPKLGIVQTSDARSCDLKQTMTAIANERIDDEMVEYGLALRNRMSWLWRLLGFERTK